MDWAAGIALLLGSQDPIEMRVDAILRQFETAAQAEQAGARLAERLMALGGSAVEPLARRLAEDLRDGTASASSGAILEVLDGRVEAQVPLQTAFADGATSAAGRIELARALVSLLDQASWRDGLLAVAADPEAGLGDRRRAAELLLEAGDERAAEILAEIGRLEGAGPPGGSRGAPGRWSEEPRTTVAAEGRPAPAERRRASPRKKEAEAGPVPAVSYVSMGVAAAGIAALLWINRRKG